MALHVTRKQLIDSFHRHLAVYKSASIGKSMSHSLILFYAVECGLKALILGKIGKNSTEVLSNHSDAELQYISSGKNGHDLNRMIKYLNVSRLRIPEIQGIAVVDLHTAWRYGFPVGFEEQAQAVAKLYNIANWIEEEI
ncbi:hypothetical protein OS242_20210 [Tumebacillus sp. DT12]|uniref:HEPN domain-containing protein n=1 Tax=Tumebacillus lacus TaxID=2995335 RepID=A0ABT3X5Q2_9BACL|nr:hypothetical protein [Tumebacillus lacus]MCX7572236.1 hypothetical protein [Tumebacillus lacus]